MQAFIDFFTQRGGHEWFLWGAYAMTIAVMALDALATWQRHRRARAAARTTPLDDALES
jgi:heme exporter protein CcmD